MSDCVDGLDIQTGKPIEVFVIAVKSAAIRCKIVETGQPITFRKVREEVEGEILSIIPSKVWRYRTAHYMTGEVESKRIDIAALNLEPLALVEMGEWDPKDEYWGEDDDPLNKYFEAIIDFGRRESYELEHIIPLEDPESFDSDPIIEASEYHECGDYEKASQIMEKVLAEDLRCLDAHAHLGNWKFNRKSAFKMIVDKARRHYEVGVAIGELSLGKDFNGVLSWRHINNRPFLRCMHGYGLSLWRLGEPKEARKVFERMIWLNPTDNQGIRFLLADIDDGKTWSECDY